jgi:hypothetical protein
VIFAVMKLVGKSVNPDSIFGVLDKGDPKVLPPISGAHWEDAGAMDESKCRFAAKAKAAIAATGYFIVGADGIGSL